MEIFKTSSHKIVSFWCFAKCFLKFKYCLFLDSEELELSGSFYVGGLDYMDPNLGALSDHGII